MKLCEKHFTPEVIDRIQGVIDAEPKLTRQSLSLRVCEWLGWNRRNGKPKDMSCRVALLRLHRQQRIMLPDVVSKKTASCSVIPEEKPRETAVEFPAIACSLSELGSIEIIPVDAGNRALSKTWNTMMELHHYLGKGPLCGAQIRYLIKSETYGYLGGLSFSAAAWRLKARDSWIGWSEGARQENLQQVVCNSRFLIHPMVRVVHLASHVLSRCVKRLCQDWQHRYGYAPVLLETFVERGRFLGTCYKAANWQEIGVTSGRGRQDREQLRALPVKAIYIYPLCDDAKSILCAEPAGAVLPVEPPTRAPLDWAEEEFGAVNLGDERLTKRLVTIARDFYARPQASLPQACQTRANTKAAYRFFDHPETDMDTLLSQHYTATVNRCKAESVILAVQDTTSLNYSAHPATADLGLIGYRKNGGTGLIVHDTMAFNTEGTPLGLLDVQSWVRDPAEFGKKHKRHSLPIEEKESCKWLKSYEKVARAQRECKDTVFVSVGDREADIFELFDMATKTEGSPKLLVRAEQNRALADGQGHLWTHLAGLDVAGILKLHVPRQKKRPARDATLEIRFAAVVLNQPQHLKKLDPIRIHAVLAQEVSAPEGVEPLEWMLLTTCSVDSFEQAVEKLEWYAKRWGIEIFHRTLKSGCKIEERQLGAADRIEACLAIDVVVAWRVYHVTRLGRETPDVPCTVFFDEAEWKALIVFTTKDPDAPDKPPSLKQAILMVACLGGFLGRKCDGAPGNKSLWLGLQRLDDITETWRITSRYKPPAAVPNTYGEG